MRVKTCLLKIVFVLISLFFSIGVRAQFPMAAHLVSNGDFDAAKDFYLKILAKDSMNFNANQELGLLLLQYYDDKGRALRYINRAIHAARQRQTLTELYLGYAQALHYNSQYEAAIPYYEKIIPTLVGKPEGEILKKQALIAIDNCKYGMQTPAPRGSEKIRVKNLGTSINSEYPEFEPIVDPENTTLMFTSRRNIVLGDKKFGPEDQTHGEMYIANNLTGRFESGMPFHNPNFPLSFLSGAQDLDALVSISQNGEHLLLCRAEQLYLADLKDGKWSTPQLLPPTINLSLKLEGGACISNDGTIIFFAASRAGGYGGMDLYRSLLPENGQWTEGENLGEDVNTSEDEDSPFLNYDENALYYSSKGLDGYGGYDIYKVRVSRKGTYKPRNVGFPINSPADDIHFSLNKNETEGYMASSRKGGAGDLDIYHLTYFDKITPVCSPVAAPVNTADNYVDFIFKDSVFEKDLVLFDARSIRIQGGQVMNCFWQINDSLYHQDSLCFSKRFQKEGNYTTKLIVATYTEADDSRKDYCISKKLAVFHPKTVDTFFEPLVKADEDKIIIKGTVEVGSLKIDTNKKELLAIKLEPIFFSTNKSDLRKDAQQAIKRNVAKMRVDATIVVKLTAHTDPRSSKDYNLKLSQKRANSVVAALEKSGIKRKRIIAVLAMGEESANAQKCKGDEACLEKIYQENRRVEFKIVGAEYIAPKQVLAKKGGKNQKTGSKPVKKPVKKK